MTRPAALVTATEQSRDLVHLLANVVRQGQASGELRHRVEPRLAAAIITSAYFAIITEWVRCSGRFDGTCARPPTIAIKIDSNIINPA